MRNAVSGRDVPAPTRLWDMAMTWHDLLFMHWPVPPESLRPLIPATLELETWEGEAWLGIVPFGMRNIRHRRLPALPWTSRFPELNVRTYVTHGGRPGVWFFSLDAAHRLAVWFARRTFHLAYMYARMALTSEHESIDYRSQRIHPGAPPAEFQGSYRPLGEPYQTVCGHHDHWLTSRYCLYSADRHGRIYRGEIDHEPWRLQRAVATIEVNSMTSGLGIRLPACEPLLHFARTLDVVAWKVEPAN